MITEKCDCCSTVLGKMHHFSDKEGNKITFCADCAQVCAKVIAVIISVKKQK